MTPEQIVSAASFLSADGALHFTVRNLYYELIRRGALTITEHPAPALAAFRAQLDAFERQHGSLARLVNEQRLTSLSPATLPVDVMRYAVWRVLVFDRVEPMLAFVLNGFHERLEIAPVALSRFPSHVSTRLEQQLKHGVKMTVYLIHDCVISGDAMRADVDRWLGAHDAATVVDLGLDSLQADRLGVSAHFEELPPLQAMRWVYRRIVKGADYEGFG